MHRRIRHPVTPYQLVPTVDGDVILVAIVALAVLLRPARIPVLLSTLGWLVGQASLTPFDLLIVVTTIALHGNRDNRSIDDLAAHCLVALAFQVAVEILEQGIDEAGL